MLLVVENIGLLIVEFDNVLLVSVSVLVLLTIKSFTIVDGSVNDNEPFFIIPPVGSSKVVPLKIVAVKVEVDGTYDNGVKPVLSTYKELEPVLVVKGI